jgi:plastocyanin
MVIIIMQRPLKTKHEETAMKTLLFLSVLASSFVSAETVDVAISNFKFTPNEVTINVGDTVRWTNTEGFHDVTQDDGDFSSGAPSAEPYVFERTFNTVEEILYYCTVHSVPGRDINVFMNGKINVIAGQEPFNINQGIAGAWFFPETTGSGFVIDIRPSDNLFFAAWFTYDVAAANKIGSVDNRWFTAQGVYSGGSATDVGIFHTSGGIFDNPQAVTTEQIGTASFDFTDCNAGTVTYAITEGDLSGSFPIQRAIPGTQSLCEDLNAVVQ